MARNTDHVVATDNGQTLQCLHCGTKQPVSLPMEVRAYVAAGKAFTKAHAKCPKPGATS